MAEGWYTPETAVAESVYAPRSAAFELRPLSLGEILDRIFAVYRSRFWLFVGITALYAVVAMALGLINLAVKHFVIKHYGFNAGTLSGLLGAYAAGLLMLVPGVIVQAATVYAISEVYLGRGTTATEAFRATMGRWYRYLGVAIWLGFSVFWLPTLFWIPAFVLALGIKTTGLAWLVGVLFFLGACAMPYGIWAGFRNSLGVLSCVVEGLTVRASMRRSKVLTVGTKGRIFVVMLIAFCLLMVAGALQAPVLFVVIRTPLEEHVFAQAISLLINGVGQTLVTPIGLIGLSLIYFDQRVRQEAFDLLMLLGPNPVQPVATVAYAEPAVLVPVVAETVTPQDIVGDDGAV
jgi:hypothetical protein